MMRVGRWVFFAAAISLAALHTVRSQTLSYIIPDIGAPDMNVYVELIGPADTPGNFGNDGLYLNNPGDPVRVVCANAADTSKITIGPVVVSWNGRMVSTQVYVHPSVEPNTDDWRALDPSFIVPIAVVVNGNTSNSDRFFIVRPQPPLRASGGGTLGAGSLGFRSRRGAMIVESASFDNAVYRVSTADSDPDTPGNQGYLPFVLISKRPIAGVPGTVIDAGAQGKNGGPGGGGGGGNFCDVTGSGSDGGGGFTGGGRGGRNGSGVPFSSDEFRNPGESTGGFANNTGRSLNGVPGGTAPHYEAAGGGTGHPFGTSGEGCNDGASCNPPGGYGGGSGQRQTRGGGGGGYATPGSSSSAGNGGQAHGNVQLVPLAGGSGGASGNPQGVSICSGEGGGGGGAVRISAPAVSELTIHANGGDGQERSNGPGGSGSGGAVSVETRTAFTSARVSVRGGSASQAGGSGRIRIDGLRNTIVLEPSTATIFRGPSTDTSHVVPRSFLLTGTGNGSRILLFLKSASMPWTEYAVVDAYANNTWAQPVVLPGSDDVYYLAAVQENPNPLSGAYTAEPAWVLSQAAANVLVFRPAPRIAAAPEVSLGRVICEIETHDTLFVRNEGDGALVISQAVFAEGTRGLTLEEPTGFPVTVPPADSTRFVVRFFSTTAGAVVDTLLVTSNDSGASRNPLRIIVHARKDSAGLAAAAASLAFRPLLLCEAPSLDTIVTVQNTGSTVLSVASPVVTGQEFEVIDPPPSAFPLLLPPGRTLPLRIRFTPIQAGVDATGSVTIFADTAGCVRSAGFTLEARADTASMTAETSIRFRSLLCSGETADTTVQVRNDGTIDLDVQGFSSTNPRFTIVSPPFPFLLRRGESRTLAVRFVPASPGVESGVLTLTAAPCDLRVPLSLSGTRDSVGAAAADVDFGLLPADSLPAERLVTVRNTGTIPLLLSGARPIGGGPFLVSGGVPVVIPLGGSAAITVRFIDPGANGAYADALELETSPRCEPVFMTVHGARGTAAVTLQMDTLRASPGDIVEAPVYLRSVLNPRLFGATGIRMTLRFAADILVPVGEPAGYLNNGERSIPLTLPLTPGPNGVLTTLRFRAALGMHERTALVLDSAEGIGGSLAVTTVPGMFELTGICREGGVRLFDGSRHASLAQNHPNPFNPLTEIGYTVIEEVPVRLVVYDRVGRVAAVLVDAVQKPGSYSVLFDATALPSGTYWYVLQAAGVTMRKTMVVLK